MKTMKRLGCLLLVLAMCLALGVSAMAASVTITGVPYDDQAFEAWQIFSGKVSSDGNILSDISWGTNITNDEALLAQLYEALAQKNEAFRNCLSAEGVAAMLDGKEDNSQIARDFAAVISTKDEGAYVYLVGESSSTGDPVPTDYGDNKTGSPYSYIISDLAPGYYLIDNATIGASEAKTSYLLKVVGEESEIMVKEEVPTLDKGIQKSESKDYSNAAIGNAVTFVLTASVPDVSDYDYYYFIVEDTLSKGLDFSGKVNITIRVGEETYYYLVQVGDASAGAEYENDNNNSKWFYVTTNTDDSSGETSVKIVVHNFLQYCNNDKDDITVTITYSAILNTNAVIGTSGNSNTADLIYSNDPNFNYSGSKLPDTPDEPNSDDPTGETPKSQTYTYTTGLQIDKVDKNDNALVGAVFQLTGDTLNTVIVKSDVYAEVEEEPDQDTTLYYLLKNGTYTTTKPNDETFELYESTTTLYTRSINIQEVITKGPEVEYTGIVGNDGVLRFEGLSAGTYTLTEVTAPDGYNKIDDIDFTITWTAPDSADSTATCKWAITDSSDAMMSAMVNGEGVLEVSIVNNAGQQLPGTGGIGTTIFYVLGAILVCGAAVVLVTRRRVNGKAGNTRG